MAKSVERIITMSVAANVVQIWRREGVCLNDGANASEIEVLGDLFGSTSVEQLNDFYSLANGMPDFEYDDRQVSFWSINKIAASAAVAPSLPVAFADFLIESWYFRLEQTARGLVVVSDNVLPGSPRARFGSFTDFLRLYLERPTSLGIFGADRK